MTSFMGFMLYLHVDTTFIYKEGGVDQSACIVLIWVNTKLQNQIAWSSFCSLGTYS